MCGAESGSGWEAEPGFEGERVFVWEFGRYFNVYGSDPEGRLGEFPRPELRSQGRISGACFDAALGNIAQLTVMGTSFPTADGCVAPSQRLRLGRGDNDTLLGCVVSTSGELPPGVPVQSCGTVPTLAAR